MWHEMMLSSWRLSSCNFPRSGSILTQQSSKLSFSLEPSITLRHATVSGVRNNSYCIGQRQEQQIQNRCAIVQLQTSIRGSSYYRQECKTVAVLALESTSTSKVSGSSSSSPAVSFAGGESKNGHDHSGHLKSDFALDGNVHGPEINIGDRERMRRHRISVANKGKVPWNKGGKHSPETIKRIRERTSQAMNNPMVIAKLRLNPRHPQTQATRSKIRDKLREKWDEKKIFRTYQEGMVKHWRFFVAEAARVGTVGEEELEWDSYFVIKEDLRREARAVAYKEKLKRRRHVKVRMSGKSQEHRQKISDAIKAKWEDPEYQSKVLKGMKKRVLEEGSRPRRNSPRKTQGTQGRASRHKAGVVVKPLDHGFVTAVMSGEKRRYPKVGGKDQLQSVGQQPRFRNLKVDLLKKSSAPIVSLEQNDVEKNVAPSEISKNKISVSAAHSFVDPLAIDKINKLKQLQANRFLVEQKRKEAVERARVLIAEAEKAAKALEAIAGNNESALVSLGETHRIIEEAANFMQRAQSVSKGVDSNNTQDGGLSNSSTTAKHLQVKLEEEQSNVQWPNDTSTSSSCFDCSLRSGRDVWL